MKVPALRHRIVSADNWDKSIVQTPDILQLRRLSRTRTPVTVLTPPCVAAHTSEWGESWTSTGDKTNRFASELGNNKSSAAAASHLP